MYLQAIKLLWPALKEYKRLATFVICGTLTMIGLDVCLSYWQKYFYNALQSYDTHQVFIYLVVFCILAGIYVLVAGFSSYFQRFLEFGIRENLFIRFSKTWKQVNVTNPEQRLSEDTLGKLIRKKVTAIAFEKIKDDNGVLPVMESMSEICGITSLLIASDYLSSRHGGKGVMLGGITGVTPTEVVIIGANTAGEYAARAAIGLGSEVMIFDSSLHRLRRFQNLLGQRLQTSVFHPQVLKKALKSADVLIGAIELEDLKPWYYITEDMIRLMKKGSVIIDLSIDRGGCIETTECRPLHDPVYEKHGVIHFSAWNLPSRVARTASIALSNIFIPILQNMADAGGMTQLLKNDTGLRNGAYLYNGILTNETLGQKFGILSKDLDLLLSAF